MARTEDPHIQSGERRFDRYARLSMLIWTRSMPRSSSATIQTCAASRTHLTSASGHLLSKDGVRNAPVMSYTRGWKTRDRDRRRSSRDSNNGFREQETHRQGRCASNDGCVGSQPPRPTSASGDDLRSKISDPDLELTSAGGHRKLTVQGPVPAELLEQMRESLT